MSAASEQIHQLKRMGFSNEEVCADLRYDRDIVDSIAPDASSRDAVDKLEDVGDSAVTTLIELMKYAESERVRE